MMLTDGFGRVHDNLRISVTDRCNIRCFYCMPDSDVRFVERRDLPVLIARLAAIPGIEELALTTNGVLLAELAGPLYAAGLRRLNVHIDTLDRERFHQITRRDDLPRVLDGLDAAKRAGFTKIKLNAVAVKNLVEEDIVPLARFARENGF